MNISKVYLTGAGGILGSHILLELLKKNVEIHALYRSENSLNAVKKVFDFFDIAEKFNIINWTKGDIFDTVFLNEWIKDNSLVIHAAGLVSFLPQDKKNIMKVNAEGTAGLVNVCLVKKNIRFCHISSIAALNPEHSSDIITENDFKSPPVESGPYHLSKYLAETEVWRAAEEGLNMVVANPGLIISGFFDNQSSGNLIQTGKKLNLFYPKGQTGMIFALDCAKAVVELAFSEIRNERFILIENNYTYKELFAALRPGRKMFPLAKNFMLFFAGLNEILYYLLRIPVFISRRMVHSAFATHQYSSEKFRNHFPHLSFQKINHENLKRNGVI
jgi:nucleoside-diphosphate-sugar epimerase